MNGVQAIQAAAGTSDMVVQSYLGDLEDADFFKRPHAECNHLAWQLGHLIAAECNLLNMLQPGAAPELPEGFAEQHNKETAGNDDPSAFRTKAEYLDLYTKVRTASRETLETVSDADLDQPNPNEGFREMFPTVGSMYLLTAMHPMMHVGQWVPVRRELGKPVVI